MKDEDAEIVLVFNDSVDFLFVFLLFNCKGDDFLVNENDLSELEILDDEDFLTRDVIIDGVEFEIDEGDDEQSFPILEHV
jgi:hypothetical protein